MVSGGSACSYLIIYLCPETLSLYLRPRTSAQLATNPNLFGQILNSIPEKSLNKIEPLIDKLGHQLNPKFATVGQTLAPVVQQRLDHHRKDNLLSDKPDRQVYQFLHQICRHFGEDEQIFFDMESVKITMLNLIWLTSLLCPRSC